MNNPECYVFGENNNSALTAAMMNGGMGGAWNNPIWALAFLAFLGRGGFGFGFDGNGGHGCVSNQLSQIQDTLNTNQGNTLLMNAIQGNATSVKELASAIGCNHNAVQTAINGLQAAICSVGNQVGMGSAQVINAIQSGNMSLANSLQSCCCDVRQDVTKMGYDNQINNLQQSQLIQNGFSQVGYAAAEQTCGIKQAIADQTITLAGKMDAQESARKDREIAALTAQVTALTSRAERQAELAPIYQALNDIKCKQPDVATVQYSPVTAVPSCVAWNAAIYGGYGGYPYAGRGGQIWS